MAGHDLSADALKAISEDELRVVRRQLAATQPHQYVRSKQMLALIDEQAVALASRATARTDDVERLREAAKKCADLLDITRPRDGYDLAWRCQWAVRDVNKLLRAALGDPK